VNVVSKRGLLKLTAKCPDAEVEALDWYRFASVADWSCFADVRRTFPRADLTGEVLARTVSSFGPDHCVKECLSNVVAGLQKVRKQLKGSKIISLTDILIAEQNGYFAEAGIKFKDMGTIKPQDSLPAMVRIAIPSRKIAALVLLTLFRQWVTFAISG